MMSLPRDILILLMVSHGGWRVWSHPVIGDCFVDIGFVMDGSGSVMQSNWELMQDYVLQFVSYVDIGGMHDSQVGVVTFGNDASLEIKLDDHLDTEQLEEAVMALPYRDQNTNTASGIRVARTELFAPGNGNRSDAADVIILMTDGRPTWEVNETIPEAELAREQGAHIFTIGIGPEVDYELLYILTGNIAHQVFIASNFDDLLPIVEMVQTTVCTTLPFPPEVVETTTNTATPTPTATLTATITATATTTEANTTKASTTEASTHSTPDATTPTATTTDPSDRADLVCYGDIGFVLDGSGSVGIENWSVMLDSLARFAETIMPLYRDTRIGVVTFGNDASVDVNFLMGSSLESFLSVIYDIRYRDQNTNTASGIRVAREQLFVESAGERPDARDLMIVITDGISTREAENTVPEADESWAAGITIYTIGVGREIDETQLYMIAGNNTAITFKVETFEELLHSLTDIYGNCDGPTPPSQECGPLDLSFILDASGSIELVDWNRIQLFATTIVSALDVGPDAAHVGCVSYSSNAHVDFSLNTYSSVDQVTSAINEVARINLRTNIADAIRQTAEEVFQTSAGDRPGVRNIAILLTDGVANMDVELGPLEASLLHDSGTCIMAIGTGHEVDMMELRRYACAPHTFYVRLYDDLVDMVEDAEALLEEICANPAPTYPTPDIAGGASDVAFLLGTSAGDSEDWVRLRDFVADQLEGHADNLGDYVFAIYSRASGPDIGVGQYEDVASVVDALRGVPDPGPIAATGDIMAEMRSVLASSPSGNAVKTIVIITDSLAETEAEALRYEAELAHEDGVHVILFAFNHAQGALLESWYMEDITSGGFHEFFFDDINPILAFNDLVPIIASMSSTIVWSCDFEDDAGEPFLCDMTQSSEDDFDWTIHSATTPSRNTGPTSAFSGTYYAFIEASDPREYHDKAGLEIPVPSSWSSHPCLTFRYHMEGFHTGALQVCTRSASGRERMLWQLKGPQNTGWQFGAVPLTISTNDMIIFRGERGTGYSGDIALDHIELLSEPCVLPRP